MRLCLAIVLVLAALTRAALAQCPNPINTTPNFTAGGNAFGRTSPQWNAYFGAKADAVDGNLCGPSIHDMPNPTSAGDAATKQYVDNVASPIVVHAPVNLATSSALPNNTYSNGTGGVGASLTGQANGALSVDGVATTTGMRVGVINELNPPNNGIYVVTAPGDSGTPYVLTRASDFNSSLNITPNSYFLALDGAVNARNGFIMTTRGIITPGVSPIVFVQFTQATFESPPVADLTALRALPTTAANNGLVIRVTDGAAGAAPMYFTSGTAACGTDDGASCVNSSDGKSWIGQFQNQTADVREWGAQCGNTVDATTPLQSALTWAGTVSGTVLVSCPLLASTGNINIPGAVKFWSTGASGYPGQTNVPGPAVWPPTSGGAINCTSTSNPCFNIVGEGVDIGYLNVGNAEPVPPSSGTYVPTVYPYIFSTACSSSWQGLHMHDMTFTSPYDGIDLEGCANYTTHNTGGYATVERINFNAPLNVGIRAHLIDYSPLRIRDIEGWPEWYATVASLGAYQRANLKFLDIEYCAACMISGVETPPSKYGVWLDNGVVNNPGTITLAYTGLMEHMNFQNSCQAIASSNTSLALWLNLSNSALWGDQSGFACSSGLPMISLPSNLVYLGINNLFATSFDTLLSVGCGTPGVGACPSGAAGGQAYVRLSDLFVNTYATNTSTAPLIQIPNTTVLSMQGTDPFQLIPFPATTGKLIGPGFDGTTGCDRLVQVGGGINQTYNAATLQDSCGLGSTTSGGVNFFIGNTAVGNVGFGTTGGMNVTGPASGGQIYI